MDDDYIYTVGIPGMRVKLHNIRQAPMKLFFNIQLNAEILKFFTGGSEE